MVIEILTFEGCPNADSAEQLVRDTVKELIITADIEAVKVVDNDDAVAKRFLGSPSIRINGKDLEVDEDDATQYSMRCRIYRQAGDQRGLPSKELLRSTLTEAGSSGNECRA